MAFLGKGGHFEEGPDIQNDSGSFDDASTSTPSTASVSTPSTAGDGITWGTVYKTVGDVPDDDISFALPKADYRNACYMWQVPNYEVVVPGAPYYRMPINHAMLSAFGFLDTDTLEEVIAVSDCSDWSTYAKGRASGKWLEMQEKILQQAVPVQSTAPAPAPTGWNWADCTGIQGTFIINPVTGASSDITAAVAAANQLTTTQAAGCAKPITALAPSLAMTAKNAMSGPQAQIEVDGTLVNEWYFSTPNQIQALTAALGWADDEAVMQKLYSFYNGNTNPYSPYINLSATFPSSAMTGSYAAQNGVTLDSSNCTLTFTLQYALNHSISKFAL